MVIMIWHDWMNALGLAARSAKRIKRDTRRWDMASEHLEGRAMLSAISSVAAEVSSAKAFEVPNVSGSWLIDGEGPAPDGTAVYTQAQGSPKVSATVTIPGFAVYETSGKFKKKTPHTISSTTKIANPDPEGPKKLVIKNTITFPDEANPTTFTGTVTVGNLPSTNITGTKQTPPAPSAAVHTAKAATFENVAGAWTLDLGAPINISGDFTVNQPVENGRKITAVFNESGVNITMKGKFDSETTIKGKAILTSELAGKIKSKFNIQFANEFSTFTGTATNKVVGSVSLAGTRQIV